MWQKLGLAFLAGGIAVGTVVYLGLKHRAAPPAEAPAPAVQVSPPALPQTEAREVPPPEPQEETAKPAEPPVRRDAPAASVKRAAAVRQTGRPAAPRAAAQPEQPEQPAQHPQATEQARVVPPAPQDVRISPPQASVPAVAPASEAPRPAVAGKPAPPKREPRQVTVPAGTLIPVRLRDALSTERQSVHDPFFATLDAPLIVEGLVIAERGALVRGRIVEATGSGRVKGRAAMVLQLDELTTSDGQKVEIRTDSFRHEAESGVKGDVAKTGVAAGIGAAIGAIAGGGKGAAIGAAIGGAAGAGGAMATRGKPAELPSETRLTFRLSQPVTLTEKLP